MAGRLLQYATILVCLVSISIVIAEMFLICHVTSREQMFKGFIELMSGSPHDESPPYHVWGPLV